MADDIDAIEEHRLDRRLPGPHAQRIIGERGIIGIQHKGRTPVGMADQIGMVHGPPRARYAYPPLATKRYAVMTTYAATRGQGPRS